MRHSIEYFMGIIKRYGWNAAFFLWKAKFRKNKLENIHIDGVRSPLFLSNYGPDVSTLFKIFFAREYNIELKEQPELIIDCGANIGLSAVFFATKYPNTLIVAVEPDRKNFEFLKKNTASFPNVRCLHNAIWSSNVPIRVVDEGKANWAIQTVLADQDELQSIPGISIEHILKTYKKEKIDLLKIDIEGAEKELFSFNCEAWLPRTKVIAIELHDSTEDIIRKTFYKALEGLQYTEYNKGENLIVDFW